MQTPGVKPPPAKQKHKPLWITDIDYEKRTVTLGAKPPEKATWSEGWIDNLEPPKKCK